MSEIQTCLAAFAVASWANNETGRDMAERAIDDYLAKFAQGEHRTALRALKKAYLALKLDSRVAIEIVEQIELRMTYLPKRRLRGGPENDQSPVV